MYCVLSSPHCLYRHIISQPVNFTSLIPYITSLYPMVIQVLVSSFFFSSKEFFSSIFFFLLSFYFVRNNQVLLQRCNDEIRKNSLFKGTLKKSLNMQKQAKKNVCREGRVQSGGGFGYHRMFNQRENNVTTVLYIHSYI